MAADEMNSGDNQFEVAQLAYDKEVEKLAMFIY